MRDLQRFEAARWFRLVLFAGLAAGVAGGIAGCPAADQTKDKPDLTAVPATINIQTARRQNSLVFLGKWETSTAGRVVIGTPQRVTGAQASTTTQAAASGPGTGAPETEGDLLSVNWKLYIQEEKTAQITGTQVEQLLGTPSATVDTGSVLVPAPRQAPAAGDGGGVFTIEGRQAGRGAWLEFTVPATTTPGTYDVAVELQPMQNGKPGGAGAGGARRLRITVADLLLPQEPAVLVLATTSTEELIGLFPATFGAMQGRYLDRDDPEHAAAVGQVDALVRQARAQGVALFVEDLGPVLHLDNVGRVILDWDAYDRTMTPYMDGSSFDDKVGLPVWLAPLPPRRVADSPTQLRQYWQACVEHAALKNWKVLTVLTHPAWQAPPPGASRTGAGGAAALRAVEVFKTIKGEANKNIAGAALPVCISGEGTGGGATPAGDWVWIPDDRDPRLPPVGMLGGGLSAALPGGGATAAVMDGGSVRVWPWMCQARGVRGVLWPHAVGILASGTDKKPEANAGETGATGGKSGARTDLPLWNILAASDPKASAALISPTLRLAWLKAGLNDAAHVGILARRAPAAVTNDLLAAVVGRSGLDIRPIESAPSGAAAGDYLYAGWLAEARIWDSLPGMIDKLIALNTPGAAETAAGDDPLYLAARMFLAQAHRPLARAVHWSFTLEPGREGAVLRAALGLQVENPQAAGTTVVVDWQPTADSPNLGGDFELVAPPLPVTLPAMSSKMALVEFQGHPSLWADTARLTPLRLREQSGGALLDLPILLPVQRMRPARNTIKLDGSTTDWPAEALQGMGDGAGGVVGARDTAMHIALGYATKPDLLAGRVRTSAQAAAARWTYDADFIYTLIDLPQGQLDDDRTSEWPAETVANSSVPPPSAAAGGGGRWWGTDGVQIQIAGGGPAGHGLRLEPQTQVYRIGIKPSGTVLVRMATLAANAPLHWGDAPPNAGGLRYAVLPYGRGAKNGSGAAGGYLVELAIPRKWFAGEHDKDPNLPVWRVNVLRHQGQNHESTSWSGPLVDDDELGLMGVLTGTGE